jgi:hypothetical protein
MGTSGIMTGSVLLDLIAGDLREAVDVRAL